MAIERYLETSEKLDITDLDWELARSVGLNDDEKLILGYFADIESQTIVYMRELLSTDNALDPDVSVFLSMWNYEEAFHGRAISRLLAECGVRKDEAPQIRHVRTNANRFEALVDFMAVVASKFFRAEWPAIQNVWGALQELTTLHGYQILVRSLPNPVAREIASRIGKQEGRHFSWYFAQARQHLLDNPRAAKLVRLALKLFWSPVGAGVKPAETVRHVYNRLLTIDPLRVVPAAIDAKISTLPGLEGITPFQTYMQKSGVFPLAPPEPQKHFHQESAAARRLEMKLDTVA